MIDLIFPDGSKREFKSGVTGREVAAVEDHQHLHFIKGDVLDFDGVRKAVDGCQIVIHCAAIAGVYSVDRVSADVG